MFGKSDPEHVHQQYNKMLNEHLKVLLSEHVRSIDYFTYISYWIIGDGYRRTDYRPPRTVLNIKNLRIFVHIYLVRVPNLGQNYDNKALTFIAEMTNITIRSNKALLVQYKNNLLLN